MSDVFQCFVFMYFAGLSCSILPQTWLVFVLCDVLFDVSRNDNSCSEISYVLFIWVVEIVLFSCLLLLECLNVPECVNVSGMC